MIWVNKRLLWITRQQYWRSQDLPSAPVLMDNVISELESFKLPCYLPISGNYHLNNLSRLSGLIRKVALFHVTGCLFPRTSRRSGPHCSCMNLLFHQLVNSYLFYYVLNEYFKEWTLWTCCGWIRIFPYTSIIPFWERLLSIPIRKRLLFLDMAMTQYFTKIV